MQKLESEPRIEVENLHPAFDTLRPASLDHHALQAWSNGETGLPFVDACMRALRTTGWMNFRMRAMLISLATCHLWLDWRRPGEHLARCFTDYEPGIHWPQVQMQSGTTGVNAVRIYNPVKQGYDHDANGVFVRRWIPELRDVPTQCVHEPWKWEHADRVLDRDYPFPIIDHLASAKAARSKIWAVKKQPGFREAADKIQLQHGSRRRPSRQKKATLAD
jgi:deoxyribodipyrimidine photo-lyase